MKELLIRTKMLEMMHMVPEIAATAKAKDLHRRKKLEIPHTVEIKAQDLHNSKKNLTTEIKEGLLLLAERKTLEIQE